MLLDTFRMEQVIINLLDNAIRYSECTEITIRAEINKITKSIRLSVSDNGIGISEEHLGRLFERFYVIDPSRSRERGGTGLGLSIVKHIVHLHNGVIQVKSKIRQGTTFIIDLPY